jgi:hypothetical protein
VKYNIVAPPWRHTSGGVMALWELAAQLHERGLDVTLNATDRPQAVTLYPEINPTNTLNAEFPVWWLLNTASCPGPNWAWTRHVSDDPLLTVNVIDLDLFAPRTGKRSGVAWWAHKGGFDPALVPDGAVRITHEWPPTKEALASLLASVEYVLSFDGYSMLNAEAALLGTPVVVVGEVHGQDAAPAFGIANTLEEARHRVGEAYDSYVALLDRKSVV